MSNPESLFTFFATGFTVTNNGIQKKIEWNNIESIIAFNEDKITYELIILDLFCTDGFSLRVSSETEGWNDLSIELKKAFSGIPENWEKIMSLRPFITNLTLLYDKDQRDLKSLCNLHYKFKS